MSQFQFAAPESQHQPWWVGAQTPALVASMFTPVGAKGPTAGQHTQSAAEVCPYMTPLGTEEPCQAHGTEAELGSASDIKKKFSGGLRAGDDRDCLQPYWGIWSHAGLKSTEVLCETSRTAPRISALPLLTRLVTHEAPQKLPSARRYAFNDGRPYAPVGSPLVSGTRPSFCGWCAHMDGSRLHLRSRWKGPSVLVGSTRTQPVPATTGPNKDKRKREERTGRRDCGPTRSCAKYGTAEPVRVASQNGAPCHRQGVPQEANGRGTARTCERLSEVMKLLSPPPLPGLGVSFQS